MVAVEEGGYGTLGWHGRAVGGREHTPESAIPALTIMRGWAPRSGSDPSRHSTDLTHMTWSGPHTADVSCAAAGLHVWYQTTTLQRERHTHILRYV